MVVVPLSQPTKNYVPAPRAKGIEIEDWTRVAAAGAIVTGGLLLLVGWRRTGMVTAAAGTALTMLDQQETIRSWWSVVPGYIDDVQRMLDQVESTVEGTRKSFAITADGAAALAQNRAAVDVLLAKIAAAQPREVPAPIIRAMENLRTAMRLKFSGKDAAAELFRKAADVLDAAARQIEEL